MRRALSVAILLPLILGLVAGAMSVAYAVADPRRALVAWIAAYGFGLAVALASLVLVMVLQVAGARWWLALRRVFVAAAGTTPIFVLLFVPIGLFLREVYPWASAPAGLDHEVAARLAHQRAWNEPRFFIARAVIYLLTWTVLAVLLRRADAAYVARPSPATAAAERRLSGVGLPIVALSWTYSSFDWLMSLQPGWVSNMYGLYVFTSGLVAALSALAIAAWLARRGGLLSAEVSADHFHAIGRLMLMAVILWAYIAFFQLLLIWIADLPAEVTFYDARRRAGWQTVDVVLFAGRFVLPFLALLSRPLKRSPPLLAAVAGWLLVMSALDFAWLVIPTVGALSWADAAPFVCVGAIAWAYGAHLVLTRGRALRERPAGPPDPGLAEALRYRSP